MNEEHQKSFLAELQSLDAPTKRKVVIVSTVVVMVIVIYLWFGYFNGLVADVSQPTVAANQEQKAPGSFFQNIKNGMAAIANEFKGSKQYDIKPK